MKIFKPFQVQMEESYLQKYICRICQTTIRFDRKNTKRLPNFCWNCGTQLKEVDEKILTDWENKREISR